MITAYVLVPVMFLVVVAGIAAGNSEPVAASSPSPTKTRPTPTESTTTTKPAKKTPAKQTSARPTTYPRGVPTSATGPYRVNRVVDGDTVHVAYKGRDTTVRLIGVDTPETVAPGQPVECYGRQASNHTNTLLNGHRVYVATDPSQDRRDRYGRLLAYLWLPSGKFVNLNLIRLGYAYEYSYDGAFRHQARFEAAESQARTQNRGLWSPKTCDGRTEPLKTSEPKTSKPKTTQPPSNAGLDPRFGTCAEANDHGYGPYVRGSDPEYDWYIDADSDGIVCEQ